MHVRELLRRLPSRLLLLHLLLRLLPGLWGPLGMPLRLLRFNKGIPGGRPLSGGPDAWRGPGPLPLHMGGLHPLLRWGMWHVGTHFWQAWWVHGAGINLRRRLAGPLVRTWQAIAGIHSLKALQQQARLVT